MRSPPTTPASLRSVDRRPRSARAQSRRRPRRSFLPRPSLEAALIASVAALLVCGACGDGFRLEITFESADDPNATFQLNGTSVPPSAEGLTVLELRFASFTERLEAPLLVNCNADGGSCGECDYGSICIYNDDLRGLVEEEVTLRFSRGSAWAAGWRCARADGSGEISSGDASPVVCGQQP